MESLELTITEPNQESLVAERFAELEREIRQIEEERKLKTRGLDAAKKDYMEAEKSMKAPLEAEQTALAAAMEAYRLSEPVQTALAEVRNLKRDYREAEKVGDTTALALIGEKIEAADLKPSVAVDGGRVQYRVGIELLNVDESLLPDRYFKRVLDEKAIKEDIDALGAVTGVEFRWTYKPSFVAK